MSLSLGAAAAIGGALAGGAGLAKGIGRAVESTALFNRDDRERLERLQALQRGGRLGLTDAQRDRMEGQQAVARGGMLRTSQDQSQQAMQAIANQRAVSGRDLFLAEQARQGAEAELRGQQAQAVAQMDAQMAMSQRQEIAALLDAQRRRKAGGRGGIAQALTLGLAGAGEKSAEVAYQRAQADEARLQREEDINAFKRSLADSSPEEQALIAQLIASTS